LPELMEFIGEKNLAWNYGCSCVDKNFIYVTTINKGIAEYNMDTRELNSIKDYENEAGLASWLRRCKSNETNVENTNSGKAIWEHIKKVKL